MDKNSSRTGRMDKNQKAEDTEKNRKGYLKLLKLQLNQLLILAKDNGASYDQIEFIIVIGDLVDLYLDFNEEYEI